MGKSRKLRPALEALKDAADNCVGGVDDADHVLEVHGLVPAQKNLRQKSFGVMQTKF